MSNPDFFTTSETTGPAVGMSGAASEVGGAAGKIMEKARSHGHDFRAHRDLIARCGARLNLLRRACEPHQPDEHLEGSGRAGLSVPQILWIAEAPRRMNSGSRDANPDLSVGGRRLRSPGGAPEGRSAGGGLARAGESG